MTALALVIVALIGLFGFAVWRGRTMAIALAAAECPDCRVPLIRLQSTASESSRGSAAMPLPSPAGGVDPLVQIAGASTWEVHACPTCERVVTTVGSIPSPVAQCPSCNHRSLAVYAERLEHDVFVDEWCDLCGRRVRTALTWPRHRAAGVSQPPTIQREAAADGAGEERQTNGQVLQFRRKS
jgi:hypothetical protein